MLTIAVMVAFLLMGAVQTSAQTEPNHIFCGKTFVGFPAHDGNYFIRKSDIVYSFVAYENLERMLIRVKFPNIKGIESLTVLGKKDMLKIIRCLD